VDVANSLLRVTLCRRRAKNAKLRAKPNAAIMSHAGVSQVRLYGNGVGFSNSDEAERPSNPTGTPASSRGFRISTRHDTQSNPSSTKPACTGAR